MFGIIVPPLLKVDHTLVIPQAKLTVSINFRSFSGLVLQKLAILSQKLPSIDFRINESAEQ